MTVRISNDAARDCASAVEDAVRQVLDQQERCVLACAGGSTPVNVFAALGDALDDCFPRLTLTLVDERHLGVAGHWEQLPDASNTRLLYSAWLAKRSTQPTVVPWAVADTLDAARDYLARTVPTPDVLLLGAGPDAHIASLFPGHPLLTASERVLALADSPKPPAERLTMSLPLLRSARHALVLLTGTAKADAAARSLHREPGLPLTSLAAPGGPTITWFLDPDAATSLEST